MIYKKFNRLSLEGDIHFLAHANALREAYNLKFKRLLNEDSDSEMNKVGEIR